VTPAPAAPAANAQRAVPLLPFVFAANEHTEEAFDSGVITPGSSARSLGPFDVPAYGYMRHVVLLVEASGGTLGAGALGPDWPFNLIQEVLLEDVNGGQLCGPISGYELYAANAWGGYSFTMDPRETPDYDATISARFMLRIPVEISHHNGMGSLANQSSASSYRVRVTLANDADPYATAPTTPADVRVRGYLEAWSQPEQADPAGRPQATMPPNHGTTQFWSKFVKDVSAGSQTILLPRVGNLIRELIFVYRDASGDRVTGLSNLPDPLELRWDSRQLLKEPATVRRSKMAEGMSSRGRPTSDALNYDGILVYPWDNTVLGHIGDGSPGAYLPTVQSTRLELVATFPAPGSLTVLTNDVAPAEVNPAARFSDGGTGFDPQAAGSGPVTG
jgi:hypothetical protein